MKIREFAKRNNVTVKMLRYYDEIELLKPAHINKENGYRIYTEQQEKYMSWINILKHLDFSLAEINKILNSPIDNDVFIKLLKNKRVEISQVLNTQISKKAQIDRLIRTIESEGFDMSKKINLMQISNESILDLLKNIPNMAHLLEQAVDMLKDAKEDSICIIRMDIDRFKSVNDDFGHDVGDRVIAAIYDIFQSEVEASAGRFAVGRAGGDEFVALLFGSDAEAKQIAEKIRTDIINYDFTAIGCTHSITCSFGIAVRHINNLNLRNEIDLTIDAVINAKKNGRNAIYVM